MPIQHPKYPTIKEYSYPGMSAMSTRYCLSTLCLWVLFAGTLGTGSHTTLRTNQEMASPPDDGPRAVSGHEYL